MSFRNNQELKEMAIATKKFSMLLLVCLVAITSIALSGLFPSVYAQVEAGSEYKDIEGCFYSMTPSSYVNGNVSNTHTVGGQQKYCYTLVDEGTNDSSYRYLVDETGDVYLFEYFTYLENSAEPTNKIAVYSKLKSLKEYTLSDGTKGYVDTDSKYVYKSVSEYLFYTLKEFAPNWALAGYQTYAPEGSLLDRQHSNNQYFAYEYYDESYYQEYLDLDVNTKYVFDLKDKDAVYYEEITYDRKTDTIVGYEGGDKILDGSEAQIIVRDENVLSYVLQREGSSYVAEDVNGKLVGETGFSTATYFRGGILYVYNSSIRLDTEEGTTTVAGFEAFRITDEVKVFDNLKDYAKEGYSLLRVNSKEETVIEAIRYYDLYEISYDLVQTTDDKHFSNITFEEAEGMKSSNVEFIYDNNGRPTEYEVEYSYSMQYLTGWKYIVTYVKQEKIYDKYYQEWEMQKNYNFKEDGSYNWTQYDNSGNPRNSGATDINAVNETNVTSYRNNQAFYGAISTEQTDSGYNTYASGQTKKSASFNQLTEDYQTISFSPVSTGEITTDAPGNSTYNYQALENNVLTNKSIGGLFYVNGNYYQHKSTRAVYKDVYDTYRVDVRRTYSDITSGSYSTDGPTIQKIEAGGAYSWVQNVNYYSQDFKGKFMTLKIKDTGRANNPKSGYTYLGSSDKGVNEANTINEFKNKIISQLKNVTQDGYYRYCYMQGDKHGLFFNYYYHAEVYVSSYLTEASRYFGKSHFETYSEIDNGDGGETITTIYDRTIDNFVMSDDYGNTDKLFGVYYNPTVKKTYYQWYRYDYSATKIASGLSEKPSGVPYYEDVKYDTLHSGSNGYQYYKKRSVFEKNLYTYSSKLTTSIGTVIFQHSNVGYSIPAQVSGSYGTSNSSASANLINLMKNSTNATGTSKEDLKNTIVNNVKNNITYSLNGEQLVIKIPSFTIYVNVTECGTTKTLQATFTETILSLNPNNILQESYRASRYYLQISGESRVNDTGNKLEGIVTTPIADNNRPTSNRTVKNSVLSYSFFTRYHREWTQNERLRDTNETIKLYSNQSNATFVGVDIKDGNNKNLTGQLYRYDRFEDNPTAYSIYNFKYTQRQKDNGDYSKTSGNNAYYLTQLNNNIDSAFRPVSADKIKVGTLKITRTIKEYFSGYRRGYLFEYKNNPKVVIGNGLSSTNFGTNNIVVDSYYKNSYLNANGVPTLGTWQGSYKIPTSYNAFNENSFFNDWSRSGKYLRIAVQNSYKDYTLNEAITLDLTSILNQYKTTFTLSYYLNGQKVTKVITYGNTASYKVAIGGSSSYTLSRIMVNEGSSARNYTPYVKVGVEGYNEKYRGYKTDLTKLWRDTEHNYTTTIANIADLINEDGSWNENVAVNYILKYDGALGGKAQNFTYTDDKNKMIIDLGDGLRLVVKKEIDIHYVLKREIYVTRGSFNGNFYNVTENEANKDSNFYYAGYSENTDPFAKNDRTVVKAGNGELLPIDSIYGKLRLLQLYNNNTFTGIVYARYNSATGEYELIEVNGINMRRFDVYSDENKTSTDGGKTFTYDDEGYTTPVVSFDGLVLTPKNPDITPTFGTNNIFENVNTKAPTFDLKKEDRDKKSFNNIIKNEFYNNEANATYITDEKGNRKEFLLLSSETVNINYSNIYTDQEGNHYKLFDARSEIAPYLMITPDKVGFTLYDEFLLTGQWQVIEDLEFFIKNSPQDELKPEKVEVKKGEVSYYVENVYRLDNLFIYQLKNSDSVPEDLRGKFIVENLGLYIKKTNGGHELVYDNTDNADNYYEVTNENTINKMEGVMANGLNVLSYGNIIADANVYLRKTKKVQMYKLLKSQGYILDYYAGNSDANSFSQLDLRYQYENIDEEIKFDHTAPTVIYGDNLSQRTEYKYELDGSEYSVYNGVISNNMYQGGLKAGYILKDGEEVAERVYYNGWLYQIGNFIDTEGATQTIDGIESKGTANQETFYNDMAEVIKIYYEIALSKTQYKDNPIQFISNLDVKYADFKKYFNNSDEKARTLLEQFYGKDYMVGGKYVNEVLPMLDLTSNFFNVVVQLKTSTQEPNIMIESKHKEIVDKTSRSLHYIQLGDVIYYRVENEDKTPKALSEMSSYLGVDMVMDSPQGTAGSVKDANEYAEGMSKLSGITWGTLDFIFAGAFNIRLGIANLVSAFINIAINYVWAVNEDVADNIENSKLATIAYSGLVNNDIEGYASLPYQTVAKVNLEEVINRNHKNYYFLEIISTSAESTWNKSFNTIPGITVNYLDPSDNVFSSTFGFKSYAFSEEDRVSRYILSDSPDRLVMSIATEALFSIFNGMIPSSAMTLYVSEDTKQYNADLTIGENEINFRGIHFKDPVSDSFKGAFADIPQTKVKETGSEKTPLNRAVIDDDLNGKYVVSAGFVTALMETSNNILRQFDTMWSQVFDAKHVVEWAVGNLVVACENFFNWLKGSNYENKYPKFFSYTYRIVSFYNYRPVEEPLGYVNDVDIGLSLIDDDYTSGTSFELTIYDRTKLDYASSYAYEIYYDKKFGTSEGFVLKGNYYYYNDPNATSHYETTNSLKNVIQQSTKGESYTIRNLPPNTEFRIRVYKQVLDKSDPYQTELYNCFVDEIGLNTVSTSMSKKDDWGIKFVTGANLVYNPYGTDYAQRAKLITNTGNNGNKYLLDNTYIDYEVSKFIFGLTNNATPITSTANRGDSIYQFDQVYLDGETWARKTQPLYFEGRYLIQKYLETDNVSKIAFGLAMKNNIKDKDYQNSLRYNNGAEVSIWSKKLHKYVLGDAYNGVSLNDTTNDDYDGIFYYTLSEKDKNILRTTYKGNVADFANNYLLNDNFEFRFKGLFNKQDLEHSFSIVWQPYYENTMIYMNYNQNFEKKTDGSFDYNRPIYDKDKDLGFTAYDVNGNKITNEAQTYRQGNYEHIGSTNKDVFDDISLWEIGYISLTDIDGKYEAGHIDLGITDSDNWVSKFIPLGIIVDGEAHIYQ